MNENNEILEPFKVYIRIKPLTSKEIEDFEKAKSKKAKSMLIAEDNLLFALDPDTLELNVYILWYREEKKKASYSIKFSQKEITIEKYLSKL